MSNKVRIVIPARYGSSRLPGKPLLDICGKPMIVRVVEQVLGHFEHIYVATDDSRIEEALSQYDVTVVMTSEEHNSGTDRLAEVADKLAFDADDIVVNLQGDEPLIEPCLLNQVSELLSKNEWASISTLMTPISNIEDLLNPNVVKVAAAESKKALYFSRAPIPYPRDCFAKDKATMPEGDYFRHLGLYAYKVKALISIPQLPHCAMEHIEKLEQLRPLSNGLDIVVEKAVVVPEIGVDTAEDLEFVRAKFMSCQKS